MDNVDAFATPGIDTPPAFSRLRRELHTVAGPGRLATSRTLDTVSQLRTRADFLSEQAVDLYRGTELGQWYADLAGKLYQAAKDIEGAAKREGVL